MASETVTTAKKKPAVKKAPKKPVKKTVPKKTTRKDIKKITVPTTVVPEEGKEVLLKEPAKKFEFRSKDGTLTSIPMVGKVNVIELRQEKRTDFLITRLPKELVLKYSTGEVKTRYAPTQGDVCVLATKYRGDAVDANRPRTVSECYVLNWCPHFTETDADLEHIAEGISDDDIKHSLLALDESKGLHFRNKWLVEKELRESADELIDTQTWSRREAATRYAAKVVDESALGGQAVEEDVAIVDMGSVTRWMKKNWLLMLIIFLAILVVASMFMPRG